MLICNNRQEAFHLAETHDEMGIFEQSLDQSVNATGASSTAGEDGKTGASAGAGLASGDAAAASEEYYHKVALYYEKRNLLGKAAQHYGNCNRFEQALRLYLKAGSEEDILAAIEVVGRARDERLTNTVQEYLRADDGVGVSKNPTVAKNSMLLICKLHQALGNHVEAGRQSIEIATQHQSSGAYKDAHELLYKTYRGLQRQGLPVPLDLHKKLVLLHSYVIVRRLVKLGDHLNASKMLLRVAENIGQFGSHVVPILTSVVVECQRAGLKSDAHKYAVMLMRPEHRSQISDTYKRKIEGIVRKKQDGGGKFPFFSSVCTCRVRKAMRNPKHAL